MRHFLLWAVFAAILTGFGSFASAEESSLHPESPETGNVFSVVMGNRDTFLPSVVTIHRGDKVRWVNRDSEAHTATDNAAFATSPSHMALPRGAAPFHSGKVLSGGSYTHQFDVPGTYVYFCVPHQDQGMIGKIIVLP